MIIGVQASTHLLSRYEYAELIAMPYKCSFTMTPVSEGLRPTSLQWARARLCAGPLRPTSARVSLLNETNLSYSCGLNKKSQMPSIVCTGSRYVSGRSSLLQELQPHYDSYYHTEHFLSGFIAPPFRQLNTRAKSSLFRMVPITL